MVTVTAVAACPSCSWSEAGEPLVVDRAADRHTRTHAHPTAVRSSTTQPGAAPLTDPPVAPEPLTPAEARAAFIAAIRPPAPAAEADADMAPSVAFAAFIRNHVARSNTTTETEEPTQ